MKTEWLVADVTPVRSPARAERDMLRMIWEFFANAGHFCGRGATLRCRNPLLSHSNFAQGHLLKIEWLVADVIPVGSPARAERDILGMLLDVFWSIQAAFLIGGSRCGLGVPS